uniref:Protein kinase domain-containing protein n=1 Tax=Strongyloides stercoralis TaxID=6248 RepID=A0A0K0EQ97_STRER
MYSNNYQNTTNLSNFGYYGITKYTVNCNNLEKNNNQIYQYNSMPTSQKLLFNDINILNNSTFNMTKTGQNKTLPIINNNSNNNFQRPIKLNSNIPIQLITTKNNFLNFGMNNILSESPLMVQNETLTYPNHSHSFFNNDLCVPYFSTELFNKVNLESLWSKKVDGSDLPCNDVTTLRFFYNFGIHQFREIQGKFKDTKNNIKYESNFSNLSQTTNPTIINYTSQDNNYLNSPICNNLQTTSHTNKMINLISSTQNHFFNSNQQLPKLDSYKSTNTFSKKVTTELLSYNITPDSQKMPHLEPQITLHSSSCDELTYNEKKTSSKNFPNVFRKINNNECINQYSNNITNNQPLLLPTILANEDNLSTSKFCNNITMNFDITVNINSNNQSYFDFTPITVVKKVVYHIKNVTDDDEIDKISINLTSTNDTLRIIKNYNEDQIVEEKNLTNILHFKIDSSNNNSQVTNLKSIKRRREISSSGDTFENGHLNDTKKLDLSPLKRSKFVNLETDNILSNCIDKLNNTDHLFDLNEDDSKNINVITSFIEPKLLQALEKLTLSYFNGKHYIIEKHNNTLQNEIDKIVSQELSGEPLPSKELSSFVYDVKNCQNSEEEHPSNVLEDNKRIRYVVETPDINNTLNQDIENSSMEEKKKFEADVIKEALKKYLIKPVEINKSPTQKINIKAYVAMPFFNTYLHYITIEYLNQIEKNFQTSNSEKKIINKKVYPNPNNSLQLKIKKIPDNDLSIVPIPIKYASVDNLIF